MSFLVATTSLPAVYRPNADARMTTAGTPHARANKLFILEYLLVSLSVLVLVNICTKFFWYSFEISICRTKLHPGIGNSMKVHTRFVIGVCFWALVEHYSNIPLRKLYRQCTYTWRPSKQRFKSIGRLYIKLCIIHFSYNPETL